MRKNPYFTDLPKSYLFPEVERRVATFKADHPHAELINLGIGDVTHTLPKPIIKAMQAQAALQTGYGPAAGWPSLRAAISERIYDGRLAPDEIFVSDGAKPDFARLQLLFDRDARLFVQDPAYPVYTDLATLHGRPLVSLKQADLICWCSPNNPTGHASTHAEFTSLIALNKPILFDAAYAAYIQDPSLPRTIFEIPGAETLAIELGSFSKLAGFTGTRLGWTAISKAHPLHAAWERLLDTTFNGPSAISQAGGLAALTTAWPQVQNIVRSYSDNAARLNGGPTNAPYIWRHFPGETSWEAFDRLLHDHNLITTPGSGFGPAGEGYLRFSAFGDLSRLGSLPSPGLTSGH
jgi:LL-diaminopimelate aminotransferase